MALLHSPRIVTDGLVLCLDAANRKSYPGSGTVWRDLAGSNNGTLTNGPTFNSSNGGSIVFDGVNDSLNSSIAFSTSNFTLSLFIYIDNSTWNSRFDIFSSNVLPGVNGRLLLYREASNILTLYHIFPNLSISTIQIFNANNIFSKKWVNVVATFKSVVSNTEMSVYINGALYNSINVNQSITAVHTNLYTMNRNDGGAPTKGNLACQLMYNRSLSPAEIQQNYNATKGRYNL
jgi:hypothetical protein